jgi:tetratricopeptide (TPR) repeat protein
VRTVTRSVLTACVLALALPPVARAQDDQCHKLSYRSNFRLNGTQRYVDQADKTTFPDIRRQRATDALRTLNEAAQNGGVDLFTMWFFFGRTYLHLNDLPGADTSLMRAAALAGGDAGCIGEIRRLRRNVWVPLQQEGVGQIQAQNYDSALVLLRRSNLIYRDDPSGYLNMATAYLQKQNDDSAAAMFLMAAHAGDDPSRAELRRMAALNGARVLHRTQRYPAAEAAYRDYLRLRPNDQAVRAALASMLAMAHRPREAAAIYDSILANADSLDAFQITDVGRSLFNLGAADTARADSAQRQEYFRKAAAAFETGARKNPYSRDLLDPLVRSYYALNDIPGALNAAKRLIALDPLNRTPLSLMAQGYSDLARQHARRDSTLRAGGRRDSLPQAAQELATTRAYRDSTLQMLQRRDSLPLEVSVLRFEPRDSSASLRGGVQNLRQAERPGFILTIEFLNSAGEVVATERVDVPTLGPIGTAGNAYDINLQTVGRGIVAFRYRVG